MEWAEIGKYLASFLGGATILGVIKFWHDARKDRSSRHERQRFLAVQLAYMLEGYVIECADQIADADLHEDTKGQAGSTLTRVPEFGELPKSESYPLIENALVERLYAFPQQLKSEQGYVAFSWKMDDDPDDSAVKAMNSTYEIAHLAMLLADDIRKQYKLGNRALGTGKWDIRKYIREGKDQIDRERVELMGEKAF